MPGKMVGTNEMGRASVDPIFRNNNLYINSSMIYKLRCQKGVNLLAHTYTPSIL